MVHWPGRDPGNGRAHQQVDIMILIPGVCWASDLFSGVVELAGSSSLEGCFDVLSCSITN